MNIQVFGTKKSFDTKKAQRYFKERRVKFQLIDLKEKGMSKGELESVCRAVGGIDKLIPSFDDAMATLRVLPRNATGQHLTSYVTRIAGGVPTASAPDGKKSMHVVFVDNGRKAVLNDPILSQALRCVRCGACANVCPVYRLVGGHRMGYIYIGAIGSS